MPGLVMIAVPAGFSPQEYLSLERQDTVRHEYRRGLVYAMAGGTPNHNRIAINLTTQLSLHLSESCQFFSSDIKVNYNEEFYYYPNVFVTCDPRDNNDLSVKRHPKLICEVLSDSTKNFDRQGKFDDYKLIDTFEEYALISQDKMQVECFSLQSDGSWRSLIFKKGDLPSEGLCHRATFSSIGLEISIEDLYRGTSV